jgi:hypothetical protein
MFHSVYCLRYETILEARFTSWMICRWGRFQDSWILNITGHDDAIMCNPNAHLRLCINLAMWKLQWYFLERFGKVWHRNKTLEYFQVMLCDLLCHPGFTYIHIIIWSKHMWWWYIHINICASEHCPSSCLLLKTQSFGDWIVSPSSGGT